MRQAEAPTRFFLQRPNRDRFTSRKFKKADGYERELSESQKVDAIRSDSPIGPAAAFDLTQYFSFLFALQRDSPNPALFVLAVVKELAVGRLDRGNATMVRNPCWRTALYGHLPDLEELRAALRSEIDPLAISGPAWGEIISAGDGRQKMRGSPPGTSAM